MSSIRVSTPPTPSTMVVIWNTQLQKPLSSNSGGASDEMTRPDTPMIAKLATSIASRTILLGAFAIWMLIHSRILFIMTPLFQKLLRNYTRKTPLIRHAFLC